MQLTYSELIELGTFEERYRYLRLGAGVSERTFGGFRYLNQLLYTSPKWRSVRNAVLIRDGCCDLAIPGREIDTRPIVHHLNPLSPEDLTGMSRAIFDMENLVTVSHMTHEAIHYGDEGLLIPEPTERAPGDTCPWKTGGNRCTTEE